MAIQPKKKICKSCGKEQYLFSKGRCKSCATREDNTKVLKKSSIVKPKKESRKMLVEELDRIFSVYIRRRTEDLSGKVRCFTCSKVDDWKNMDCGHFWSRRYFSTRWDEVNCQVQCKACNIFNQGAGPQFAMNLQQKYGKDILMVLEMKKNNVAKHDTFALKMLINHYEQKVAELK